MPISIKSYRNISNTAGQVMTAGKTVHLSKSGDALVLRGSSRFGRMVSWVQGYRATQHGEVRQHFLAALSSQYGQDVTGMVASQARLNHAKNMKKPLTSREVFLAFKMIEDHQDQIKEHNDKMASSYADPSDTSPTSVTSKISKLLSTDDSVPDMQKVREYIDVDALGNKIRERIQRQGNNGKHRVSEAEAGSIADRIIRTALVEKHKKTMMDKYLIPKDASKKDSESFQLLSKLYERRGIISDAKQQKEAAASLKLERARREITSDVKPQKEAVAGLKLEHERREITFDAEKLGKDTVNYLNEKIEHAITNEMYSGRASEPVLLGEDRVVEIVEGILDKFTEQRIQVREAVDKMDIPDKALREELASFVTHTNIPISQVKSAWSAGMAMRPHLKVISDADQVSEKELKDAVNGYMNTISAMGDASSEADVSVESRKARSFVMMLAQGDDRYTITQELHRQITEPGPFRDYRRAMNYYRVSFQNSDAYAKQEGLYLPSVQRAQEFAAWMEGLGLVLAERLDTPKGEEEILAADEFPGSPDIDDRTITLMRNTGIKIPTPERMNCEGEGIFCDEAVEYIEQKLATGSIDSVEDDICEQFLLDVKMRDSDVYFDGVKASSNDVVDKLKEFCTDENGDLDRNAMFAVSQIHQGVFGPPLRVCFNEQTAPIPGIVAGKDDSIYRFDKNNDGSISVRAENRKYDSPVISTLRSGDVFLDRTKSEFNITLDLRLDPTKFTNDRDHYFPPQVINATYQYSLYAEDE